MRILALSGATFIAFETVGQASGLPILSPMSAIAGRLAVQAGAWCLQKQNGGSGVLLPGVEGIAPGKVVIVARATWARTRFMLRMASEPPSPSIRGRKNPD